MGRTEMRTTVPAALQAVPFILSYIEVRRIDTPPPRTRSSRLEDLAIVWPRGILICRCSGFSRVLA